MKKWFAIGVLLVSLAVLGTSCTGHRTCQALKTDNHR